MKDLRTYIEELGIELKPIGKGIYRGWCPVHEDKKSGGKPQFTFYEDSQSWFCYRDGIGGDVVRLLAEVEKIPYIEAKRKLIGTEQEQLQENLDKLDSLDIDISQSYNLQLNLTLRPKFRDLLYKYPSKQQDILMAMKALDDELKNKITFQKMGELFERFKLFSEQVEETAKA
jgi:DNA primase